METERKISIEVERPSPAQVERLTLLHVDLTERSAAARFAICCSAVFLFYLAYGYLQELIFTLDGFEPYGWYLTLVQFLYYAVFGLAEKRFSEVEPRRIPLRTYATLALLTLGTMGFSNSSLGYLNYPTQVIFKCCKLVPVLIGGVVIQGKRYGFLDYAAAVAMCVGLSTFILADSSVSPNFDTIGVIMISIALLCDAAIGNVQEKAMRAYRASNAEVVLYSYGIGFVYLLFVMSLNGGLVDGFYFCAKHPFETYGYGFLFSLTGYLGIQAVLTLVRTSGAPTAATVTTCRKAVTMIFSFLLFEKPFVFQYLWSGCIVLFGIYLNVYSKKHPNFSIKLRDIKMFYGQWRNKGYSKRISAVV